MSKGSPNPSDSDDSDIEIRIPIAKKAKEESPVQVEATKDSEVITTRKEKEGEKEGEEKTASEDQEKHALHELIRTRLSKKSGYKPDLSWVFVLDCNRQKAAQTPRRDVHVFEVSKDRGGTEEDDGADPIHHGRARCVERHSCRSEESTESNIQQVRESGRV